VAMARLRWSLKSSSADNDKVVTLFVVEATEDPDSEASFHCVCNDSDAEVESVGGLAVGSPTRLLVSDETKSLEQSCDVSVDRGRCKVVGSHVDGVEIVLDDEVRHFEDMLAMFLVL
jgi:hypothetical protein